MSLFCRLGAFFARHSHTTHHEHLVASGRGVLENTTIMQMWFGQ